MSLRVILKRITARRRRHYSYSLPYLELREGEEGGGQVRGARLDGRQVVPLGQVPHDVDLRPEAEGGQRVQGLALLQGC